MTDFQEKHSALVEKLWAATKSGKVAWTLLNGGDKPYTDLDEYRIIISQSKSYKEEPIISIGIFEKNTPTIIEAFSDDDLRDLAPSVEQFSGYFSMMYDLYKSASRQAKGAGPAIDAIIRSLEE